VNVKATIFWIITSLVTVVGIVVWHWQTTQDEQIDVLRVDAVDRIEKLLKDRETVWHRRAGIVKEVYSELSEQGERIDETQKRLERVDKRTNERISVLEKHEHPNEE